MKKNVRRGSVYVLVAAPHYHTTKFKAMNVQVLLRHMP